MYARSVLLWPAVAMSLAVTLGAAAQIPQTSTPAAVPPSAATVGFMHAIHATNNVETTLAFYTEVFGVRADVRPFENPAVAILTDSPGVKLRIAMLQFPGHGFNFELTEFSNVPRTPAQPAIVDPGAPHMKILVRDLQPVLAGLDEAHAVIVTRSLKPVRVKTVQLGAVDAIFFRDPDGYLVEAVQVPAPQGAKEGNVLGSIMGLTVADLDASLAFWHGQLGFDLERDGAYSNDAATLDLVGVKGNIEFRTAHGVVPGSNARIEVIEFRGVPRKPFDLRVPDPGASGMAIRVAAIDQLLPKLDAAGVRIVSKDRKLVEWSPTLRNVFVKDPNGLNIELVGDAPKRN
jgi:catechol 2,3-dioxygenase-like lactoylglutathione lyase family enzyme